MMFLLLLPCLAAVSAGVSQRCAGPVIAGVHHTDEVLKSGLTTPLYLNYDKTTNALYYTHYFSSRDAYKLDLETKIATHIAYGVYGVSSVAVDSKTSDIFIGASEGIFKYNKNIANVEFYGAKDIDIWGLFSKDCVIYFNIFNFTETGDESFVYKLVNGEVSKVEGLKNTAVRRFIVDNDDYIIFTNSTGLFRQKLGTEDAVLYGTDKFKSIKGFTINTNSDVYAAASGGIYLVNKQKHTLDLIFAMTNECYGVAFDSKNNMIYADGRSIHRLKSLEPQECV